PIRLLDRAHEGPVSQHKRGDGIIHVGEDLVRIAAGELAAVRYAGVCKKRCCAIRFYRPGKPGRQQCGADYNDRRYFFPPAWSSPEEPERVMQRQKEKVRSRGIVRQDSCCKEHETGHHSQRIALSPCREIKSETEHDKKSG